MLPLSATIALTSLQEIVEPLGQELDLTSHWAGYFALAVFIAAYTTVILEEKLHLRKSIPVMIGAGLIWSAIGIAYILAGDEVSAAHSLRESLGEFAELF